MNDLNRQVEQNEPIDPKQKAKDLARIKKAYFPSSKMADAQELATAMSEIAEQYGLDVVFNFNINEEIPTGFGMAIIPISRRIDSVTVTLGVAIGIVPDLETVQQHENGQAFINDCAISNMMAKLANSVRPRGDTNETAASIPASVVDFITSNRAEGVLVGFNTYASAYVKVLKKSGLRLLTTGILRQVLQSAAFAEQQFPKVGQDKWEAILNNMIDRAEKDGVAVGMLADWKNSRNSAELVDNDIDLADLDFGAMDNTEEVTEENTAPVQAQA